MELIKHVYVEENGKGYIRRAERDTRPVVDKLYGINIPAYPFTFDTMEKDLQADEITDGTSIIEYAELVGRTIDETRDDFTQQVAERFPNMKKHEQGKVVGDLMRRYVLGVFGIERDMHTLDAETEKALYGSDALTYAFVLHRVKKLKTGHAVIKMLMLKRIIYPTWQAFTVSADYERLYLQDEVNTDQYLCGSSVILDITEDVYKLLRDYEVIPPYLTSLGEYMQEAGTQRVADALALILFGYTDNDCVQIHVARTGIQHMNKLLEKALQKRTSTTQVLALAQVMADDVLAQQQNAQNATGADF